MKAIDRLIADWEVELADKDKWWGNVVSCTLRENELNYLILKAKRYKKEEEMIYE